MKIDHIGIVVKSIEKGLKTWIDIFGYSQFTEVILNKRQKVRVVFLVKDDSLQVKLLEPADETSPIYTLSRSGGGLHHICFKCDDIKNETKRLSDKGLRVIASPQPGEAFENEFIAFLFAKQGLNIELIDTDKRAKRLL